jgi:hypothetical protein
VRERDQSRHLAVGAGAPSDPDDPDDPDGADGADETGDEPETPASDDVVQAVAEFLDDLVDDPTFAHDPPTPHRP